jgi:uncharacterized membrane protein YiaA
MAKNALQKIEDHEKLCRIMQKQTHDKIHKIENQINRLEKIVLVSAGMLIMGMANMIFMLLTNTPGKIMQLIAKFYSSRVNQVRHSHT